MKKNQNLINQLQEFGLNPHYWILKKLKQKHRWIVRHKKNRDLYLIGTTEKKKGWKNLEWAI